jgi:hypothetical protein
MQKILLWVSILLILIEASAYAVLIFLKYHLPGGAGLSDNMVYSLLYTYRRLPIVIALLLLFAYTYKPGR